MEKRGQAWGIDLGVAFVIFTFGLLIFFFYAVNKSNDAQDNLESMFYDGNVIADSVLSEGSPEDWNLSDVAGIGVLSENKINGTKLEYFYNLSVEDYNMTQRMFNTRFNYYFFISGNFSVGGNANAIGLAPDGQKDLIKITRFTIYNNKPTTAYFYIWE